MSETPFGIGTGLFDGEPGTAIIVEDHVMPLAEIVRRHATPGAAAPAMRAFIADWDRWLDRLVRLELKPDVEDGWLALDAARFTAPVPEPNNLFQVYHNYHARAGSISGKLDPPKEERVLPDVFLGSRSALAGYGETVCREHGALQFDFEVEVAAVVGRRAWRVRAEHAERHIAGYAIANDLTMHNSWWRPIRRISPINDHIRMKNFPGYTPMSRAIVPRDLVGDPHDLSVKAWRDGQLRQDTRTNAMIWRIPELIEYLSWVMPLEPGDLIMTGSPEELPLDPGDRRGLEPGQTVTCEVERLGRLVTKIAAQDERQPSERDAVPPLESVR